MDVSGHSKVRHTVNPFFTNSIYFEKPLKFQVQVKSGSHVMVFMSQTVTIRFWSLAFVLLRLVGRQSLMQSPSEYPTNASQNSCHILCFTIWKMSVPKANLRLPNIRRNTPTITEHQEKYTHVGPVYEADSSLTIPMGFVMGTGSSQVRFMREATVRSRVVWMELDRRS